MTLDPKIVYLNSPNSELPAITEITAQIRKNISLIRAPGCSDMHAVLSEQLTESGSGKTYELITSLPPLYPEWLGDRSFQEVHNTRFPYIGGAMAKGIASVKMVIAFAKCGMLGFFGSAGLSFDRVKEAIDTIQSAVGNSSYGVNLINSPQEPELEENLVTMYLEKGVRRISAAAYMDISPALVRYRAKGLSKDENGNIVAANFIFAKISRTEVASKFLAPAPAKMLSKLVAAGKITQAEADMASLVPVSEDITVEGDSGGHTDNQLLVALLPTIMHLRDTFSAKYNYQRPIRVGAAGGLGTPASVAAAYAMGAAYIVTGSVNQSCLESGVSEQARKILLTTRITDVMMAPAADMFEMGVKVQVVKRGSMFGMRANKLYALYTKYDRMEDIPADDLEKLEKSTLGTSWQEIWKGTEEFFAKANPAALERAQRDPHYQMALIFRWYLGLSSVWAVKGEPGRERDYQIWCGPALGAFNNWVKGRFLNELSERTVEQVALNLLEGAAVVTRASQLRTSGLPVPGAAFDYEPRRLALT